MNLGFALLGRGEAVPRGIRDLLRSFLTGREVLALGTAAVSLTTLLTSTYQTLVSSQQTHSVASCAFSSAQSPGSSCSAVSAS